MTANKTLVLVDGSSYLYRAFHAMPALSNSRGIPTGAVYGVTNMLRRLIREYAPDYMAVVFDAPGRTFRDDLYPEYKAHRPPMPDPLVAQIEPTHEVIRAHGLPLLMIPNVEADDVIATLAAAATRAGMNTLIASGDKDLAQLVDGGVRIVDTMKEAIYDRDGVVAKYGVPPERIVDYLALMGDASDNVPGVANVGPKTAAKWIQEYGSLDNVMAHAGEIGGKIGENLRAALPRLPLSRQLVTVRTDVPLDVGIENLRRAAPDVDKLRALYQQLEFRTWLKELLESAPAGETPAAGYAATAMAGEYETVLDEAALDRWLQQLAGDALFAFDTETTDLDVMNAELVGVSLCLQPGKAAYIPLAHRYPGAPDQLDRARVLAKLKPILEDTRPRLIGQNIKYDMSVLARHGIALQGLAFDTMLESYVLDSTASRHDMDSLALKYLGHKTITYDEVTGTGKGRINFNQVDLDTATRYAAEDADVTLKLHAQLWPRIEQTPELVKVFRAIEMPLVPVLSRMERHGVRLDTAMLREQSTYLGTRLQELEREAHALAGQPFNLASPPQIQEILYTKLGLPVLRKTPKGAPSTAEEVLEELALEYPLPRVILDHRGVAKLKSTYTDKLPEMVNARTGRVHTSYQQAVAATGRLSSSDPNLQNIPVRTEEGRRIRRAFVAAEGYTLVSADYSQIELRIMAHLSGDAGLIRAFESGADVHRATAAEVFGVAPDAVTTDMRRNAKAINFGLIYGMSAFGLARQLRIERNAAQRYIDLYFSRYPGVREFMDRTRAQAHDRGYVETVFGRRLYLPEIKSANAARRQYAERTAINAPMQGTAADLIKLAMVALDRWILDTGIDVRMIMQVHDELVFEVADGLVDEAKAEIGKFMTGVARLRVPLVVDVGRGRNWDESH
jgi:DNA polymerase-1